MLFRSAADPPDHTRLRPLVNKAFSKRMLDTQRAEIVAIVDELINEAAELEEFDFIDSIASPLPGNIVGQMMGVETSMRANCRGWSERKRVVWGASREGARRGR